MARLSPLRLGEGKDAGEPPAHGGRQRGSRGAKPPWHGVWGMCPQNFERGGELPTLATRPRVGPKPLANPKPTRVGKRGARGRSPHGGGRGGCPPTNSKEGASSPLWKPRHEWDPRRWRTQSQRGWENGGPGGEAPMAGGLGDVPPKTKRGRVAHLSNPATSGAQATGKPKANEGGKTGVQGAKPPWQGVWGMCPQKPKGGELPALATRPRVGPRTLANPKSTGVGDFWPQAL